MIDISYHEAAHAVVAVRLGLIVSEISIQDSEKYEGHTIIGYKCAAEDYLPWIKKDATVDLAGVCVSDNVLDSRTDYEAATEKLTFYVLAKCGVISPHDYDCFDGGRISRNCFIDEGFEGAWKHINGPNRFDKVWRRCESKARNLIKDNHASITKVAARLVEVRILDDEELRNILEAA